MMLHKDYWFFLLCLWIGQILVPFHLDSFSFYAIENICFTFYYIANDKVEFWFKCLNLILHFYEILINVHIILNLPMCLELMPSFTEFLWNKFYLQWKETCFLWGQMVWVLAHCNVLLYLCRSFCWFLGQSECEQSSPKQRVSISIIKVKLWWRKYSEDEFLVVKLNGRLKSNICLELNTQSIHQCSTWFKVTSLSPSLLCNLFIVCSVYASVYLVLVSPPKLFWG